MTNQRYQLNKQLAQMLKGGGYYGCDNTRTS